MKTELKNELLTRYRVTFGHDPAVIAYAPGRVEVIGNHTDYNEGYVLSAAISFGTFFAVSPLEGRTCRLVAGDLMREVQFPVDDPKPVEEDTWANYCMGVHKGLLDLGKMEHGYEALFYGDIPQGSGLSSSAALENTTALALAKLYGIEADKITFAKIGQKAEHTFAGVKCGLLDQISSLYGQANTLVQTDFRTLEVKNVPFPPDAVLVICNSNAKHALVDGAYNERRRDCESATAYFAKVLDHPVTALRDVSWAEWQDHRDEMNPRVANRSAHPIGEDERVLAGAKMLDKGDLAGFGRLMFASHQSSIRYFENSCPELDYLVESAKHVDGVYGARLSGGGFGGSVVALVQKDKAETAAAEIAADYEKHFGIRCSVCVISPSDGAHVVRG